MSTRERMMAYIQKTKMGNPERYELVLCEMLSVLQLIEQNQLWEAIELCFDYGRAKGYRMAKKEMHRG